MTHSHSTGKLVKLLLEVLRDAESASRLPGLQFEHTPASSLCVPKKGSQIDAISMTPLLILVGPLFCRFIVLQTGVFLFSAVLHVTQHRLILG